MAYNSGDTVHHGGRSLRQQVTLHPQTEKREVEVGVHDLLLHGMVLPTVLVGLPCSIGLI